MAATVYLVLAMRRPDFNAAAVQPHLDFLDALRAQGRLQLTGGFADGSGGARWVGTTAGTVGNVWFPTGLLVSMNNPLWSYIHKGTGGHLSILSHP